MLGFLFRLFRWRDNHVARCCNGVPFGGGGALFLRHSGTANTGVLLGTDWKGAASMLAFDFLCLSCSKAPLPYKVYVNSHLPALRAFLFQLQEAVQKAEVALACSGIPPGAGIALFLTCSDTTLTGVLFGAGTALTGDPSMRPIVLFCWLRFILTQPPHFLETESVCGQLNEKTETERRTNKHTKSTGEIRIGTEAGTQSLPPWIVALPMPPQLLPLLFTAPQSSSTCKLPLQASGFVIQCKNACSFLALDIIRPTNF